MKIGILTFHKAYNYGALLQCYSLMKKIQETFDGCSVEVIDYASLNMMQSYETESVFKTLYDCLGKNGLAISTKLLVKFLLDVPRMKDKKIRERNRNRSIAEGQDFLDLSPQKLISDDIFSFVEYIESNNYDLIVVGSDAIWNDRQTMVPNVYYLKGVKQTKKVSYAASMYGLEYKSLSDQRIDYVKQALCDFDYIGVRDIETEAYIKYTNQDLKPYHNCDPSIFLDLSKLPVSIETVKEKFLNKGVNLDKPIIGLMCGDWLAKEIKNVFKGKYQLVSLYEFNRYSDFYIDNLTPFEWAIAFSLFKATFTHFFHGTIFSLKNYTRTFAIEKKSSYSQNYKTKINDILDRLGLMDCYFEKEKLDKIGWSNVVDIVENSGEDEEARYIERVSNAMNIEESSFESFKEVILEIQRNI